MIGWAAKYISIIVFHIIFGLDFRYFFHLCLTPCHSDTLGNLFGKRLRMTSQAQIHDQNFFHFFPSFASLGVGGSWRAPRSGDAL